MFDNLNVKDRQTVFATMASIIQQWIKSELAKVPSHIDIDKSVIFSMLSINITAADTLEGQKILTQILTPVHNQFSAIRLHTLAMSFCAAVGYKNVQIIKKDIIEMFAEWFGKKTTKKLMKKYPYLWIIALLQTTHGAQTVKSTTSS